MSGIAKNNLRKSRKIFVLLTIFLGLGFFSVISASTTDGTINNTYKYAWSDSGGWINFGTSNGNIHITDSGITGYAWNENYGWINMSPTYSGVEINASGALSGYAWGQNCGWVNFSGVSIDCSGQFAGTASNDTLGTVTFGCSNCSVVTDYRPQSCRGGGGGGPIPPPPPPPPPPTTYCGDTFCNGDETCASCPADCGICTITCGNGVCDENETCVTCADDCGTCPAVCGDGACNGGESCASCPLDCGECPISCGDGSCNGTETCASCPLDCGECEPPPPPPPILCGDGICSENEACDNCPIDCGECIMPPPLSCGNGSCNLNETCDSCPSDCGKCPPPVVIVPPIIPPQIKEIVKTPIGSVATKVITTTGVATTAVTATTTIAFASPLSLPELFLLPTRLIGLILVAFGWKKRNPPWGIVYDSITKQPLDPAYVVLKDLQGKDVSSAITDIDGRYGFLVEPGSYRITAKKTNYLFPSQKLAEKTRDELYDNLYFGEAIEIRRGEVITRNIPLDPLKFDWNEFIKQSKRLTRFYSHWDSLIRKISDTIFVIGFIVAIIAFFSAPYPYNTIILSLYLFLTLLRILGLKPKRFGYVIDRTSGTPLAFAIMRIGDPYLNREIGHRITDKYGRYFCLVPRGKYFAKIEKKNDDGSYSLVHTSDIIDASKNGLIKNKFKV